MDICARLGNGELDFYTTMAEFNSSWKNINITQGSTTFISGGSYDVWIPFKYNPSTHNYEHYTCLKGNCRFNSSMNLNGSALWSASRPSARQDPCVACTPEGCYDYECYHIKAMHKCKFVTMNFLHTFGLCDKSQLGNLLFCKVDWGIYPLSIGQGRLFGA